MNEPTSSPRFRLASRAAVCFIFVGSMAALPAVAEPPFTVLHSFSSSAPDGSGSTAALILDGSGYLYGTTFDGGPYSCITVSAVVGCGTVFRVKTDGTGFTTLHAFSDGVNPSAGLILDPASNLYGTAFSGGNSGNNGDCMSVTGCGTIFRLKTDGTGFAVLHSFSEAEGAKPVAGLVLDESGNLYGTTSDGDVAGECGLGYGCGSIFTIKTDGTKFSLLHSFTGVDGANPFGGLIFGPEGNLYGTTTYGGADESGTVFTVKSDGTGFRLLHSFSGPDGTTPQATMILDASGNLYGTTTESISLADCSPFGPFTCGKVFKLKSDGTEFTILHSFISSAADGAIPNGLSFDANGNLIGTTEYGGLAGVGAIFGLGADGSGFSLMHSFSPSDAFGEYPRAGLTSDGAGNFFGTTNQGGTGGGGTVFKFHVSSRPGVSITSLPGSAQSAIVTGR